MAQFGGGVDIAVGDFGDPATVGAALNDVDQVYLVSLNHPRQVEWETTVIDAAVGAGVDRIVKQSTTAAEIGSVCAFWDMQGRIEQHLLATSVPSVFLKAGFFMTNVLMSAGTVRDAGALFLPAAGARVAMVDPRDVAEVAATILATDVSPPDGARYEITGPEAITFDDVAAELSALTGRTVTFVAVPDEAAFSQLTGSGVPDWFARNLVALLGQLRDGAGAHVGDGVREVTGRAPRSVAQFLADHAVAFR